MNKLRFNYYIGNIRKLEPTKAKNPSTAGLNIRQLLRSIINNSLQDLLQHITQLHIFWIFSKSQILQITRWLLRESDYPILIIRQQLSITIILLNILLQIVTNVCHYWWNLSRKDIKSRVLSHNEFSTARSIRVLAFNRRIGQCYAILCAAGFLFKIITSCTQKTNRLIWI